MSITRHLFSALGACLCLSSLATSACAEDMSPPVLDADGNGLYDDAERALLLEVLQQACPALQKTYDTNGDGLVSKLEQTAGDHPLSMRIDAEAFVATGVAIPWGIDVFPEWITSAFLKEDLPSADQIGRITARGTVPAEAMIRSGGKSPERLDDGCLHFPADGAQKYVLTGRKYARWDYRWCLLTFRVDAASGTGADVVMVDINAGDGSGQSTPKIWYDRQAGLQVQYLGGLPDGVDRRLMSSDAVVADGRTWNVLVCGVRQGRVYAVVNGMPMTSATEQPDFYSCEVYEKGSSYIGDNAPESMAWDLDALVFGLTEPSEATVRKLTGWGAHRLGFAHRLPAGHPYRVQRPMVDAADFPYRYRHDLDAWTAWGKSLGRKATQVNTGGERVVPEGFVRVFYDDFRADRVVNSRESLGGPWMAPGWNPAVGADVPLADPEDAPDAYAYDAENHVQTISLVKGRKGYVASAIYTVNDMGQGYTWKGPKVFRTRCRFPKLSKKEIAGGLFPAFWSYDPDSINWRTANRIEVDYFEHDGKYPTWYNGLASHYHYPYIKNDYVKVNQSYKRYKIFSGKLDEQTLPPDGWNFWDGLFHTWEIVIGEQEFFVNVTMPDGNGGERWVELCRAPTAPTYLERLDLQFCYALRTKQGVPNGSRQDLDIDWVEVLQRPADVDAYQAPFTGRPVLRGATSVGGDIRCDANLEGITDIRYYWFADAYPLGITSSPTYTVTEQDRGTSLRCMVKAVGATSMPEAWSEAVRID